MGWYTGTVIDDILGIGDENPFAPDPVEIAINEMMGVEDQTYTGVDRWYPGLYKSPMWGESEPVTNWYKMGKPLFQFEEMDVDKLIIDNLYG